MSQLQETVWCGMRRTLRQGRETKTAKGPRFLTVTLPPERSEGILLVFHVQITAVSHLVRSASELESEHENRAAGMGAFHLASCSLQTTVPL